MAKAEVRYANMFVFDFLYGRNYFYGDENF